MEFGVSPKTVSSKIKAAGIIAGNDGMFSTAQISQALFDSDHFERIRLVKEQAEAKHLANAEARKELVNVDELADRMTMPLAAMRQCILSVKKLTQDEREEILANIQDLYGAVFGMQVKREAARKALAAAEKEK